MQGSVEQDPEGTDGTSDVCVHVPDLIRSGSGTIRAAEDGFLWSWQCRALLRAYGYGRISVVNPENGATHLQVVVQVSSI